MFSIKEFSKFFNTTFILGLGLTLAACGGGGGSAYPSIGYTGATGAATLTAANAGDFPIAMLEGSSSSSSVNPYAAAIDGDSTQNAQHAAMLSIAAEQMTKNILSQQNNTSNLVSAASTQTQEGTCSPDPGSITVTDNTSATGTDLSASITYDNYCVSFGDTEILMHGKINFTGTAVSRTPLILSSITISIEYLKLTVTSSTQTVSEEFSGSITITFDKTEFNNVTNISITSSFQANGLTYKVENLVIDRSSGLAISGRFYHPTHGYVDVVTTQSFTQVGFNPEKYCGGIMELTGTNASSVSTTIEFEANLSCSQYRICVRPTADASCIAAASYINWPQ